MVYCKSLYHYQRRLSRVINIGSLKMGGSYPIRVQSMLTSNTMDTKSCVREALELVDAGCEIVRITAPTVKDAANLKNIHATLRAVGCDVPLVADIHFKPEAAMEAALWVEKVRINPGNFADSKKFQIREYSDLQYEEELERIRERFAPLVERCKERSVAIRIGTNHGSLSDRIMNRFGDTPVGMVESALEFARIARDLDYHQFVFSMKASNPKVMIATYRLLVARLAEEGADWNYPIHLGVTEAGDGEDGRIKSAIGIGSLLADGIGDTIRVSLTEDSKYEIPVARDLLKQIQLAVGSSQLADLQSSPTWPLFEHQRRVSEKIMLNTVTLGDKEIVRVVVPRNVHEAVAHKLELMGEYQPELILENLPLREIDPRSEEEITALQQEQNPQLITVRDGIKMAPITAFRLLAARVPAHHPILLKDNIDPDRLLAKLATGDEVQGVSGAVASRQFKLPVEVEDRNVGDDVAVTSTSTPNFISCEAGNIGATQQFAAAVKLGKKSNRTRSEDFASNLLASSTVLGSLLCDGIGDAILIRREAAPGASLRLAYNILQAAGVRIFKTDYVACPSCGRTLFNLQETTARIKAATGHLKGVRIAIMGCIVNGPGEMADADFGYVGGAPGKINLYVGKKAVKFNIPQAEAVERLVELIREHGKWAEA